MGRICCYFYQSQSSASAATSNQLTIPSGWVGAMSADGVPGDCCHWSAIESEDARGAGRYAVVVGSLGPDNGYVAMDIDVLVESVEIIAGRRD